MEPANERKDATSGIWRSVAPQRGQLCESPFWHPQERLLYWLDIKGRSLHRCDPALPHPEVAAWPMPSEPGCFAPAEGGGFVIALRDGIYRAQAWGGALRCLLRFNHDSTVIRFNDGKCDPLGRFWAGTLYEPRGARKAELYSIDCRGGAKPYAELKAHNATTANGLAWSPDAGTLYWTDTPSHAIQAWDWDADSNVMRRHRVFAQFAGKPPGWSAQDFLDAAAKDGDARKGETGAGPLPGYGGRPDGAAVDAQGNYWVAMYEGGRLLKLSPAGALRADIAVPALYPTMPCFGGPALRTLFLTTAQGQGSPAELACRPQAGRILAMEVDVPGLPVNFFRD